MKTIILLSALLISCGASNPNDLSLPTSSDTRTTQPTNPEDPETSQIVYKVYLPAPGACIGYNVTITFFNQNEQDQVQVYYLSNTWTYTFTHDNSYDRWLRISVNRQGALNCSLIHTEIWIDGVLAKEVIGSSVNQIIDNEFYLD